jgi:hypothetical protein
MPNIPGFPTFIPGSPQTFASPLQNGVLGESSWPMIYTTTGPLSTSNGLVVTADTLSWDASYVESGDLDCGVFGSQA